MADIARKTKRYPSDLTDEEWDRIAPLMPGAGRRGRPREVDLREIINALRYLVRSGCGWEMLPVHFGPWQTVYWWFRRLMRRFLFQTIHDLALMCDRERAGREASPSAGVIDSQSVKAPAAGAQRGYDAGKKVVGRKRHIAVDTDGRLLMVNLTPADISDSAGAQAILDSIRKRWPWVKHMFADGAYVLQALRPVRVEPMDPVAQGLTIHAAHPRRLLPIHAVENRRQRKKPATLVGMPGAGCEPSQVKGRVVRPKFHRSRHGANPPRAHGISERRRRKDPVSQPQRPLVLHVRR